MTFDIPVHRPSDYELTTVTEPGLVQLEDFLFCCGTPEMPATAEEIIAQLQNIGYSAEVASNILDSKPPIVFQHGNTVFTAVDTSSFPRPKRGK